MVINTPEAWDERARADTPWEAALWSQHGQEARFEALAQELGPCAGRRLLDYGSGHGALRGHFPEAIYEAYDWSPEMRRLLRDQGVPVWDYWPASVSYDVVVCCGTFNLLDNWSKIETAEMLRQIWMLNRPECLAVCLYSGSDPACLQYSPFDVMRWVADWPLVSEVATIEDYLPNDFMLVVQR